MPTVTVNGKDVPVTFHPGLLSSKVTEEAILAFPAFRDYCRRLDPRFVVQEIEVQAVTMFGPRVGFMFVNARLTDESGAFIPGAAFLRGGSVVIMVRLDCEGQRYTVLTKQPRSPVGSFELVEFPAGMLDGSGNFVGTAAKELKEELGIEVTERDLFDLYGSLSLAAPGLQLPAIPGIYASPGGTDEFYRIFLHVRKVTRAELDAMRGKCTGNAEEGEQITLEVVPVEEVPFRVTTASALATLALCHTLSSCGMLQDVT